MSERSTRCAGTRDAKEGPADLTPEQEQALVEWLEILLKRDGVHH